MRLWSRFLKERRGAVCSPFGVRVGAGAKGRRWVINQSSGCALAIHGPALGLGFRPRGAGLGALVSNIHSVRAVQTGFR